MVADLPVATVLNCAAASNAILNDRIFPSLLSPTSVNTSPVVYSAPVFICRISGITIPPCLTLERSAHFPPPVIGAPVVLPRILIARPGSSIRSRELRDSEPSLGSEFFPLKYLSRVCDIVLTAENSPPYQVDGPTAGFLARLA